MDCRAFRLPSNGVCSAFSPNGLYFAIFNISQLKIYSVSDLKPIQTFKCLEIADYLEWSTDSELVLSAYFRKGEVEVWRINQHDWSCRIRTGAYGLMRAQFTPDSRHILTVANLHLRISIWSLSDKMVSHIDLPKDANPGLDFSVGGSYMAVAESRMGKDCVAIYSCDTWNQISVIDARTVDLGGLKWSPDGSKIAIWDGSHCGKLCVFSLDGSKVCGIAEVFGVHDIEWSPSAQILAVATAGSKVKLVNHLSWRPIATLNHSKVPGQGNTSLIYRESDCRRRYHVIATTDGHDLLPISSNPSGRLSLAFSMNARFLAVLDHSRPQVLWIWDIPRLSLQSVLIHISPIKDFKWSGYEPRLALVCGTASVYTWTPVGTTVTDLNMLASDIVTRLRAGRIEWSSTSHHLMVSGPEIGCVCQMK